MKIIVTGTAGFIGSSLAEKLLKQNYYVIGLDNFFPNYEPVFKRQNILPLTKNKHFVFYESDIRYLPNLTQIFKRYQPQVVYHVAALPGVRASLRQPKLYQEVNVIGTQNVYLAAVESGIRHFIYTSSSSVYGESSGKPFHEEMNLRPLSPYAKTKYEAEKILAKLFHKHRLRTIILRLFSVYGPKGRPDMAPYLFTEAAFRSHSINQYGDGTSARDYTNIDDVVNAILSALDSRIDFDTINIGSSSPVKLSRLIALIEKYTGHRISRVKKPKRPEEARITYADVYKAEKLLKWKPRVTIESGVRKFIDWYKNTRLPSKLG